MENMQHAADKLNKLLQGEISAVETYRQALSKIDDPEIVTQLSKNESGHSDRVRILTERVRRLGVEPAHGSGLWGGFAKLIQGGATAFGTKATIDVLEEGEDRGLSDYRTLVADNDPDIRAVVQQLLPGQEATHKSLSELKHRMH